MNYKLKFLVKNKLKQLVQFYIKLKVWINIGKTDSSHFIYREHLPY